MGDQEQTFKVVQGDGYAVGHIDAMGEGYGFRKIRRELDVSEFGVNALVLPPRYEAPAHYHERQQEIYSSTAARWSSSSPTGRVTRSGRGASRESTQRRCANSATGAPRRLCW